MKRVYGYKPVMYYTNGYSTKIIDGIYPDRDVVAFHSIDDLELILQRRRRNAITDLMSQGIAYNSLTDEQKEQPDEYLGEDPPTPDFNIPDNEIFRHLFNKDTCVPG